MATITCVGEMLIDLIPDVTPGADPDGAPRYRAHPGGALANVAVAVARLGGTARFVGALSTDAFGEQLLGTLTREGVATAAVQRTDALTALAVVSLSGHGERRFTFYGADAAHTRLDAARFPPGLLAEDETAICCAGSVALAAEPARTAVFAAMDAARAAGALVAFDVNARPALWPSPRELRRVLREAMPRCDLLKLSEEDAPFLLAEEEVPQPLEGDAALDRETLERAGRLALEQGVSLVALSLGADGVLLLTRSQRLYVPTQAVRAIDTTGAGDAWMGAFLVALTRLGAKSPARLRALPPATLERAARLANAAAALSCTRPGGIASLPTAAELDLDARLGIAP